MKTIFTSVAIASVAMSLSITDSWAQPTSDPAAGSEPGAPEDTYDSDDPRCTLITRVMNISATGEVDFGLAVDGDAAVSVVSIGCLRTDGGTLITKKGFPMLHFETVGQTTNTLGDVTTSVGNSVNIQVGGGTAVVSGTVGGGTETDADVRHGDIVDEPVTEFEARCIFAPGDYHLDYCSGGAHPYGPSPEDQANQALDEKNLRALIIAVMIENNDPLLDDYLNDVEGAEEALRDHLDSLDTTIATIGEELLEAVTGLELGGN